MWNGREGPWVGRCGWDRRCVGVDVGRDVGSQSSHPSGDFGTFRPYISVRRSETLKNPMSSTAVAVAGRKSEKGRKKRSPSSTENKWAPISRWIPASNVCFLPSFTSAPFHRLTRFLLYILTLSHSHSLSILTYKYIKSSVSKAPS